MREIAENDNLESESYSLREKAGQLFMPAAFINDSEEEVLALEELIREVQPGGLCFFHSRISAATNFEGKKEIPFNANSLDRLKKLISRYQKVSKTPLLIAMDAEWGLAMRIENTPQYPYALTLGALEDTDPLLYETGLRMAQDCREAGIHWNLAPVVDCNTNPDNPVIGYRSFGSTVRSVSAKAASMYKGMRDGGILTCAKHFPGHGDTATDSHLALPVLNKSLEDLESEELIPFRHLIAQGIPAVMTGHLSVPELDPSGTPASLSKPITTGVLRERLGFSGLIITDALNMHAVSKRETEPGLTALRAFEAGNDMLCFATDIPEALNLILNSADPKDLNARLNRIAQVKASVFNPEDAPIAPRYSAEALNRKIAERSLTALTPEISFDAFRNQTYALIHSGTATHAFATALRTQAPPEECILWNLSAPGNTEFQFPLSQKVVLALSPPSVKPPHQFGFSVEALEVMSRLVREREVCIYLFGNPYLLQLLELNQVKAMLLAYQNLPTFQEAAANHFLNHALAPGKLAVRIHQP